MNILGAVLGAVIPSLIGGHHHSSQQAVQHVININPSEVWHAAEQSAQHTIEQYVKPQIELMKKYVMDEINALARQIREEHQRVKAELAGKGMLSTAWGQNIYDKMTQQFEQRIEQLIDKVNINSLDALREIYTGLLNARANLALGLYRQQLQAAALQSANEQQFGQGLAHAFGSLFSSPQTTTPSSTSYAPVSGLESYVFSDTSGDTLGNIISSGSGLVD